MNLFSFLSRCFSLFNESYSMAKLLKRKGETSRNVITLTVDSLYCLVKYGADAEDYNFFNFHKLDKFQRDGFISRRKNDFIWHKYTSKDAYNLFLDKTSFNRHFKNYIRRKWISSKTNNLQEAVDFIKTKKRIIIKPLADYGGHGIIIIKDDSHGITKLTEIFSSSRVADFIAEEIIENCYEIKKLNPSSLNTLRVVTLMNKRDEIEILNVIQRFGTTDSSVDNATSGGLSCRVDIKTGKMIAPAISLNNDRVFFHPTSNLQFDGYIIPKVKECVELAKKLASQNKEARYLGWDFVVTKDGSIELLEANIPPGHHLTQLGLESGYWGKMLNEIPDSL